jgi:opine dehydrogenase
MSAGGPIEVVTVVGAGSGGFGLLANLGAAGYRLRLLDRDESRLAPFRERGGIAIEGGERDFAPIEVIGSEAAPCIAGTDLIAVCTGGNAQPGFVREVAPLLEDGQILLLIQGNTGGSLVARRELAAGGCRADVDVAEFDTYPYGVGRPQPARAQLRFSKRWNQIAAFPGRRSEEVFARLAPLFPQAVMAQTVASTSFTNMNATFHVAVCVANAGRIESGQPFKFYAEGVTPAVACLLTALDAERLAVARALGAEIPDIPDWIDRAFGFREATLAETFQRLTYDPKGPYQFTPAPASFSHNYVAEDVPTGLMPMAALGGAAGVPTPVIDAIVRLARVFAGRDFAAEARTLERMGLAGQDAAGIRRVLMDGFAE